MSTEIEEHLAHHTAAIDDISAQMAQQWATIRRLEAQVERLAGIIRAIGDEGDIGAPDIRPPPHY